MTPTKKLIERAKRILALQRGPPISLRVMQELTEQLERYERALEKCKEQRKEWSKMADPVMPQNEIDQTIFNEDAELEAILNPQEKGE